MRRTIVMGFSLLAVLASAGKAYAGSGPATLTCTGMASGSRLTVKGTIPATEAETNLEIRLNKSLTHLDDENSTTRVVENFARKFFVLVIIGNDGNDTVIYAEPDTVQVQKLQYGLQATFSGRLSAPRPGLNHAVSSASDFMDQLRMTCTYRYEI